MTTTMLEALGLAPDEAVGDFDAHLVTATVVAVNPDAVVATFTAAGQPRTGVLPAPEQIPHARYHRGQQITALVCEPLSALTTHPRLSQMRRELVSETLAALSPEVRTGTVRVMGVARKAGVRTKVAVAATVEGVDPVAACVGRGHNRVDALRAALGGEQVDIIAWHHDQETYLRNALQPAGAGEIVIDEVERTAVATAPLHQMSAAVGGGGLNSALAGRLVGLSVRIAAE